MASLEMLNKLRQGLCMMTAYETQVTQSHCWDNLIQCFKWLNSTQT